tara:strand:- start:20975 stop:21250 length:276 start_codon:yes stop_codon:yes gene_type:complete
MPETIIASLVGGTLSSLRKLDKDKIEILRRAILGVSVGFFTAPSVATSLSGYFDITVSNGAAGIVISYYGPWIIEEIIYKFRAMQAFAKWK